LAQRGLDQAKLAHDEPVRGFTAEAHEVAKANVGRRRQSRHDQGPDRPAENSRLGFSLREDLIAGLKAGDRLAVNAG